MNLKIPSLRVIIGLLIISLAIPAIASAAAHPNLLFNDINEVPGYQYSSSAPWSTWKAVIINSADASLSRDFSDPNWATYNRISYRSGFASDLGLAYQITKDNKYLEKARQALLNLDVGDVPYEMDRAVALRGYALAYDWVQPGLSAADDNIIRDKLAVLADRTYRDLNGDGAKTTYVSFADYHGQAYPSVAIAGLALEDYTNPNNLALKSGPDDWTRAGTDYLFENDELHTYNRPLISFGFDEASGKHLLGAYKNYVIDDLLWWFQVYSNHYDKNILDDYPVAKKIVTSELWETMPNGYMNNYVTGGNTLETYQRGIMSLLDTGEKAEMIRYLDMTQGSTLLPYSRENDLAPTKLLFCVYGNYNSVSPDTPDSTSRLDEDAIYQVFRENWDEDADWLSLVTFDVQTNSNRDSAHHDQLSIEYYGDGDLLLADAGETKHVLDNYYGQYEVHHNGIAIEDPQTPFATSSWADSQARGVYKGYAAGITTPTTVETVIESSWMEGLVASETITKVIGSTWSASESLSSPIDYSRTILYPEDDYFIVFDRFDGSEEWTYRNVLRPTSLSITPTGSAIGHVNGDLKIGGTTYNWLSPAYKDEIDTGITTNSLTWSTTNPYGDKVSMNIYSAPASDVLVTKHAGRVAGYDTASEVYTPVVYLKDGPEEDLYRITVLTSNYAGEEQKNTQEIPVSGNGNAIRVSTAAYTDTIYSGAGASSFGDYSTNAESGFIRTTGSSQDYSYTLIKGTYLNKNGAPLITSTGTESVSMNKDGNAVALMVDAASSGQVSLYQLGSDVTKVLKDGVTYTGWKLSADKSAIIITTAAGSHEYTFLTSGEVVPAPVAPEAGFSASPTTGGAPLSVQFTDSSVGAVSSSWNFGDGTQSTATNPTHTYTTAGTYTVTLAVTGVSGTDTETKTGYITVTSGTTPVSSAPVAAFTADVTTGTAPLAVQFTDASTNSPTSWAWTFGDGASSTAQNPSHSYTDPGTYTVTLKATNAAGTDTETKTGYITVTGTSVPSETTVPVAAFTADTVRGGAPLEVTFSDQSLGNPASWTWYFGDGKTSYDRNPTHTYTGTGTYTVTLRAINALGVDFEQKAGYITVTDEDVPVVVTNPPVAAFSADVVSGTAPLEVSFTDKSTNSPVSWVWTFGDGASSTAQNPTHSYMAAGTYTVSLKVTNADGTDTETKSGYITVTTTPVPTEPTVPVPSDPTVPVAAFTADTVRGGAPMEVTFTDESLGNPTSWTWYFGDGKTSYDRNPAHTYTGTGTYTVTLRVINALGVDFEQKAGYITVTDEDVPVVVTNPPVAAFSADVVSGTAPLEVSFTDKSTNSPVSWAWTFGDGTTASEENPVHVYSKAGTYTVSLKVTNADGTDTETKSGYITVTTTPVPSDPTVPVAAFTADIVSGTAPMEVTFSDESLGSPTSWTWYFGDGKTSYDRNPTHTYTQKGKYTVTLRVINGQGLDFETKKGYISVL
ncbi:hypothetical protein AZH53_04155 [Methanomicrobiaceae archaeon CYW5]|uniref:PKD domain-containing protein n=1 Tax=Methanovulcanius yangii TaxID=1789227 RepID=UPI0029C9C5D4|nr:PKD domain-containing protein [Methanovulcanius yangii]MBT8507611.1 hypothetical protein [Methanovulcanius yangii]